MTLENNKKKWLDEVSFMRVVLLVFLVSYHAFAPFTGPWIMPEGFYDIDIYRWIGLFSRAFRLEGFVFVSGYIFTYQLIERQKFPRFLDLFGNKVHRLYIPGFVFSLIYCFCFVDYHTIFELLIICVNGAGHLWYLPCLFWCFLIQYLIIKQKIKLSYIIPLSFVGVVISVLPLPLQLNKALYYICFFSGGGLVWQYSKKFKEIANLYRIAISWAIFLCLFVFINIAINSIEHFRELCISSVYRGICWSSISVLKAILAGGGIFPLYLTCVFVSKKHSANSLVRKMGACGYGIYVFHQFVIIWLYGYTDLSLHVGIPLLPWVSFLMALTASLGVTLIIRQTKMGRKYL